MHRFRKRSDARRNQLPELLQIDQREPLPSLPPASDFRTSLILPDLTRRFSVLRTSSGTPIGLDELKNKFAEQRARGSEHQLSEEEEDMILEALGRLHTRNSTSRNSTSGDEDGGDREDVSTPTLRSPPSLASISSTKGSSSSRRMSNNLFGSGKFRDQAYLLRTSNQTRRSGSSRSALSVAQSESTMSMSTVGSSRAGNNTSMYSDTQSMRPVTPEGSTYSPSASAPSSPNNNSILSKDRSARSTSVDQQLEYASETQTQTLGKRLSRTLSPEGLRRASLALDEVIRELEEEGDDEIVMERSPISHVVNSSYSSGLAATVSLFNELAVHHLNSYESQPEPEPVSPFPSPGDYEAGTAVSFDEKVVTAAEEPQRMSPHPGSRTTSPTPRLPGYIPGMPRPMTPRDFDSDDQTPSTTPRATSPRLPGINTQASPLISQSFASTMYRSNSSASITRQSTSPSAATPPLFFNRSMNGRFTPEERERTANDSISGTDPGDSPVLGRRRPLSPLSGPAYKPLSPSSRPGTPSNVTWNMPSSSNGSNQKSHGKSGSASGHSRNGSSVSLTEQQNTDALERAKSLTRSLRSPALPDSPWIDGSASLTMQPDHRPPSAMSGMELGSPIQVTNRPLRSPTPTHNNTRSPSSAMFPDHASSNGDAGPSRRSSKQNAPMSSSTFSLGPGNALLLSPIANSSRSSLESAGSSYHTWDEDHKKDRLFGLFSSLDSQQTEWHDTSVPSRSSSSTPGTSPYEGMEAEEIVRRQIGLTKSDFVEIQDRLYPISSSFPASISSAEDPTIIVQSATDPEMSSPMRRNRALAEALFGLEDRGQSATPSQTPMISVMPDAAEAHSEPSEPVLSSSVPRVQVPKRKDSLRGVGSPSSPYLTSSLSPLSPRVDASALALEVQRRAEAATAALRKSPSIPKINDSQVQHIASGSAPTKYPHQFLYQPQRAQDELAIQENSRNLAYKDAYAKWRGSDTISLEPKDSAFSRNTNPQLIASPLPCRSFHSSATPGIKGFMARFRKPRLNPESLTPTSRQYGPSSTTSATSATSSPSSSSPSHGFGHAPHSAPALKTNFRSPSPSPVSPPPQSPTPRPPSNPDIPVAQPHNDEAALKQLFDAASNLGLDQVALNELIARSPSTSSRSTAWTKLTRVTSITDSRKSHPPPARGSGTPDSVRPPSASEGRPSIEAYSPRPSAEIRPSPVAKVSEATPRARQADGSANAIVRRTIIVPSDSRTSTVDLNMLLRKQSSSRRRRSASALSVGSNRSVHDRVPTPPPPHRSTSGRRFSTDASPPVPQLPLSFSSQAENLLAPPGQMEKSSSAYDSLYEMYTGESRNGGHLDSQGAGSSQQPQIDTIPESGPALEVIEMANGETIWSIVNGLRDGDGESLYGDRSSFISEYSVRESNSEGVKLFFKEHARTSSKSSATSFLSRKKLHAKGANRPETKVFFSSSAQIGRLIENLSRGTDAGSFNIAPERSQAHVGHSTSSSVGSDDMRWTVEERLEHMLGSMGAH
ncbi:hypothetical protein A0H81_04772 [Grifola frondosa]|uniref:Uncharacterized protein n=1 Tax=Grifola frondosa TaxID=5627 RepID=A0A1C7MGW7_GRIFR|nr:hypothetical protein A0H81_04772 [Grifola frondosa]